MHRQLREPAHDQMRNKNRSGHTFNGSILISWALKAHIEPLDGSENWKFIRYEAVCLDILLEVPVSTKYASES